MVLVLFFNVLGDLVLLLHQQRVMRVSDAHGYPLDLRDGQVEVGLHTQEGLRLLDESRVDLLHPGLLALEMVIDDHLLLYVIEKLVTNSISLLDAVSDRGMPLFEVVHHFHHPNQVNVLQNWINDGIILTVGLVFLDN